MKRRLGFTLVEVLVAIFIMAIGLLALLTLFPLGALRMATALQDERAASSANAGANICDAFGMRQDPLFDPPGGVPSLFLTPPTPGFQFASQSGGGMPIYVDPWGVATSPNPLVPTPLGASPTTIPVTPGITRVVPSVIHGMPFTTTNAAPWTPVPSAIGARYFTLPDDMTFLTNGLPDTGTPPGSTAITRAGRYTWAYLLKRPQPGYPSSPVDLTVVVYAGRTTALPSGEATYVATGLSNTTSVVLTSPRRRHGRRISAAAPGFSTRPTTRRCCPARHSEPLRERIFTASSR